MELTEFQTGDAVEIASWPVDVDEARNWAGAGLTESPRTDDILAWHRDPDVEPFVLRLATRLVAYGEIWIDPQETEIELARIIVKPSDRRTGLGAAFVRLLVEKAKSFSIPQVTVRVSPQNLAAIRGYERVGFWGMTPEEHQRYNTGQPVEYRWFRHTVS